MKQMTTKEIVDLTNAMNDMAVPAVRYALPRLSYINTTTAAAINLALDREVLSKQTMSVILRDINEAITEETIPYDDQVVAWRVVLERITATI